QHRNQHDQVAGLERQAAEHRPAATADVIEQASRGDGHAEPGVPSRPLAEQQATADEGEQRQAGVEQREVDGFGALRGGVQQRVVAGDTERRDHRQAPAGGAQRLPVRPDGGRDEGRQQAGRQQPAPERQAQRRDIGVEGSGDQRVTGPAEHGEQQAGKRPSLAGNHSDGPARTQAILRGYLLGAADGDVEVLPDAVLDTVDAAMNLQRLATVPGVLNDAGVADVGDLLDDVQLAHTVDLRFLGGKGRDVFTVLVIQVADGAQPTVDQPQLVVAHGGPNATTAVVAGDQNVLDLEYVHRELDDRKTVEVGVQHDVGDVAVDEQIARQQADNLVGRYSRIGATDPQILRCLLLGQFCEERRVFFIDRLSPTRVVLE